MEIPTFCRWTTDLGWAGQVQGSPPSGDCPFRCACHVPCFGPASRSSKENANYWWIVMMTRGDFSGNHLVTQQKNQSPNLMNLTWRFIMVHGDFLVISPGRLQNAPPGRPALGRRLGSGPCRHGRPGADAGCCGAGPCAAGGPGTVPR